MLLRTTSKFGKSVVPARFLQIAQRSISGDAVPVTVAHGDGIGPEIMESTLAILKAAGANMKVSSLSIRTTCSCLSLTISILLLIYISPPSLFPSSFLRLRPLTLAKSSTLVGTRAVLRQSRGSRCAERKFSWKLLSQRQWEEGTRA